MRRHLTAIGLSLLLVVAVLSPAGAVKKEPKSFPQGVASGEVRSRTAILWTRAINSPVRLHVATDDGFQDLVRSRRVAAPDHRDGTVSALVTGLKPGTQYFYRFFDPETGQFSRTGAFVTAPRPGQDVNVHFAYSGDSDGWIDPETGKPAFGPFRVLNHIASHETLFGLQFFMYLGDTIYSDSGFSPFGPADTVAEYRKAYKQNRSIPALRNLMASVSTYANWDDHEVRNDFDSTVDPDLFAAGMQAFEEYMPIRSWDPELGFYETFRWGKNLEFFVLDGRSFRSQEVDNTGACDNPPGSGQPDLAPMLPQDLRMAFAGLAPQLAMPTPAACIAALNDPARTLLGEAQKDRFMQDLMDSDARFKLVFNDVPIQNLYVLPYDRWEGYLAERTEILDFISSNGIENVVWLTTDTHANIINDVFTDFFTGTDSGTDEVIVGPIGTSVFSREIIENAGFPPEAVDTFVFFVSVVLEAECADIDTYAYGNVLYDAATGQLSIQPIGANGNGLCVPLIKT